MLGAAQAALPLVEACLEEHGHGNVEPILLEEAIYLLGAKLTASLEKVLRLMGDRPARLRMRINSKLRSRERRKRLSLMQRSRRSWLATRSEARNRRAMPMVSWLFAALFHGSAQVFSD